MTTMTAPEITRKSQHLESLNASISSFIDALAREPVGEAACNQYAYAVPANAARRDNLRLFLGLVAERAQTEPRTMLVGEAPGYRGCRLTGVPFSSEALLLGGIPELGVFGTTAGYRLSGETSAAEAEQTATIFWEAMRLHGRVPLVWNAYPFHPHKPGDPRSNRQPLASEVKRASHFLSALLEMFPVRQVVAVGNHAARACALAGVDASKVRHPSHGGKKEFMLGCARIFGQDPYEIGPADEDIYASGLSQEEARNGIL